jgi:tRNA-dihydrouridine synthase C
MRLMLAPMEGLLDFTLRDTLTRAGGIDLCVSEFIRVTDQLLPRRAFLRIVPELAHGGRTPAGVPVRAQLLGSDPACLADNAARLASMGPAGIDLNFGCPAKVVNRHGGGAMLLQDPPLIERIVRAVRAAVPAEMPVSAKMRLGFHDDHRAEECALAMQEGGASELVVHARTRVQGYKPPAYWARIADLRRAVRIPLVANGEVWNVDDARRCLAESGCDHLMLGRGMVADPGLAQAIRRALGAGDELHPRGNADGCWGDPSQPLSMGMSWDDWLPQVRHFWALVCGHLEPRHRAGRLKQWLNYLRRRYPQAQMGLDAVRTLTDPGLVDQALAALWGPGWAGSSGLPEPAASAPRLASIPTQLFQAQSAPPATAQPISDTVGFAGDLPAPRAVPAEFEGLEL